MCMINCFVVLKNRERKNEKLQKINGLFEVYIARSRDRNPMDGIEPPPSGKRRSENESEVRSSKINPILDGSDFRNQICATGEASSI